MKRSRLRVTIVAALLVGLMLAVLAITTRPAPVVVVESARGVVVNCPCNDSPVDWIPGTEELIAFEKSLKQYVNADEDLRSMQMSDHLHRYRRRYSACGTPVARVLDVMFIRDDAEGIKNWRSKSCWSVVGGGVSYWYARYDLATQRMMEVRPGGEL